MQNPLGTTASVERRRALAAMLERLAGPLAIEDAVYAFLDEKSPAPLRAFAPDQTILVDSLSKRIGPGLTLGMIAAPEHLVASLAKAIVAGVWGATGFAMEVGTCWLGDGTVATLEAAKRHDAGARQEIARRAFENCALRAHPFSYHVLLNLPPQQHAAQFVKEAAADGIAIAPAAAFSVLPGHAPNAVRVGLANLDLTEAEAVLRRLAAMAQGRAHKPKPSL